MLRYLCVIMLQKKEREVNVKKQISASIGLQKFRRDVQARYDKELALAIEGMVPLKHGRKPCKIYRHGYYDRTVTLLEKGSPVTIDLHVARLKYFYDDGLIPSYETITFQGEFFLLKGTRAAVGLIVSMMTDIVHRGKPVEAVAGLHAFSRSSYYRLKSRLKELFTVSVPEEEILNRMLAAR